MAEYSFDNLIGNANIMTLVQRQLNSGTFRNLTLFSGIYGTGKSTTARIAAMRLTCENPIGPNPCCQCATCRSNIQAFKTTGASACVKVVNLGIFDEKKDVGELIKDIFILRQSDKPMVYLFEEVHALKNLKGAQTAFLTEIDRMPENTYVIMCTTNERDVIPELVSRSLRYQFTRLSRTEQMTLIRKISRDALDPQLMMLIAKYSDGVPRNIISSVEFVTQNAVSLEEYKEFIQYISEETIALLFDVMQDTNITKFINICDELIDGREASRIFYAIKEFLLNCLFYKEGAETELAALSKTYADSALEREKLIKCLGIVDKYNTRLTELDLRFMLYKLRLIVQGRSIASVVSESNSVAASVSAQVSRERDTMQMSMPQGSLRPLDVTKLKSFK